MCLDGSPPGNGTPGAESANADGGTDHMTRMMTLAALATLALLGSACGGSSADVAGAPAGIVAGQTIVVTTVPADAEVVPGAAIQFVAQVTGTGDSRVVWSVDEADGGSIDANGLYTAPATEGTFHVHAELVAQAGASSTTGGSKTGGGSSTVRVSRIAVSVSPAVVTVAAGGSVTFTATVTGTSSGQSTAVIWSVPAGAGSIDASTGVYTAPSTAGTYTVTAFSVANTAKKGTATVTVSAPPAQPAPPPPTQPVAISISPATATLDGCAGQVFTATVTNTSNTAVTWSVVEAGGGTITNGAYVAPSTPGTYHVSAVSQADPTKIVQATITVGPEKVLSVAVTPGSGTVQANGQLAFAATVTTTCGTFAAQ